MLLRQIFDDKLAQYAYLIGCQRTGEALVVDPERDVDRYLRLAEAEGLRVTAVTETHIHADFVSGTRELASRDPRVRVLLSGEGGADWSYRWSDELGDRVTLLHDGDRFRIGEIELQALHTPGHTPEHLAFLVTDRGGGASDPMALLAGDFLFVGDLGRPDLLESAAGEVGAREPAARMLRASVGRLRELPEHLQIWPGHGAGSACGKALGAVPVSTLGYELRHNPALAAAGRSEGEFIDFILSGQPEPPLYFARMKRWNRDGPPVLGELPRPRRLGTAALDELSGSRERIVLDTRTDRAEFLAGHLPGALYVPLERSFPTVAGSFLEAEQPIVLQVEEERLDEAIRDLVRIGLDRIEGWFPREELAAWAAGGGDLATTESIDFEEMERRRGSGGVEILDVRSASEHAAGAVPDSRNIAHTRLAERLGELPRDRQLLVHCRTGFRASVSTALLEREGFDAALVDGEFAGWREAESGAA